MLYGCVLTHDKIKMIYKLRINFMFTIRLNCDAYKITSYWLEISVA